MSNQPIAIIVLAALLLFSTLLAACGAAPAAPQPTPLPPTVEEIPPTETLPAPTETAVPTDTPVPPTATSEPTATDEPTATSVPPTATTPPTTTPMPPLDASGGGVIAYVSESSNVPGIQIMNADGTDQRRLTDDYHLNPSWSPDGRQIVFQNNGGGPGTILTVDVLSGEVTIVTDLNSLASSPGSPDWSPDGNSFAVTYNYYIYTMNTSGGAFKKLIDHPKGNDGDAGLFSPDWSADGQRLAFALDQDYNNSNFEIFISDADGSNLVQLTSHEEHDREPSWSPDGTKITFQSYRDGNWDIFTMNADGSNIQNITNTPDREWNPAWSPDGARIAFQSDRDGNWEIYVMNTDGTDVQRLTDNDVKDEGPEWRP
jgi:Tol biopolymer transport system component